MENGDAPQEANNQLAPDSQSWERRSSPGPRLSRWLSVAAGVALLVGLLDLPGWYATVARCIACLAAVFVTYNSYALRKVGVTVVAGWIAMLWVPTFLLGQNHSSLLDTSELRPVVSVASAAFFVVVAILSRQWPALKALRHDEHVNVGCFLGALVFLAGSGLERVLSNLAGPNGALYICIHGLSYAVTFAVLLIAHQLIKWHLVDYGHLDRTDILGYMLLAMLAHGFILSFFAGVGGAVAIIVASLLGANLPTVPTVLIGAGCGVFVYLLPPIRHWIWDVMS